VNAARELIFALAACAIISAIAVMLAGNGIFGKLVKLVGGILTVLIILRALTGSDWGDIERLVGLAEGGVKKTGTEEAQRLIQRSYNAYISSRAGELGLDCEAEFSFRDGASEPTGVTVYYAKNPGTEKINALKAVIADELGIPAEAQKHAIEGSSQ
jgi:hypothetical protein